MFDLRISETSPRIPLALFVVELAVFFAAVLTTAYFGLFLPAGEQVNLVVWVLRAMVLSGAIMLSMALFKLYQGRPTERMGKALLRLAASFTLGGFVYYLLSLLVPLLHFAPLALIAIGVMSFFLMSTVRPVFLDSVTERRGRRRNNFETISEAAREQAEDAPEEHVSQEDFLDRVSRNASEPTTLTGQHRITRRGL